MESADTRITAARLLTLRNEATALPDIAALLGVPAMPATLAAKTTREIEAFLATGDATAAAQLVHAALVRQKRAAKKPSR